MINKAIIRHGIALLALFISIAPSFAMDKSKWEYMLNVKVSQDGTNGIVEISLPPELIADARENLGDLRLITSDNKTVPYVLRLNRGYTRRPLYYSPQKTFNQSFIEGKSSSVTVDFGSSKFRRVLEVSTEGDNFRRRVKTEGSNNGTDWQTLTDNSWIFAIPVNGVSRKINRLNLPENDYRYYRITVYNAPFEKDKIVISGVKADSMALPAPDLTDQIIYQQTGKINDKEKSFDIEIDFKFPKLQLYDLKLDFLDKNFMRQFTIYGRNRKTAKIYQKVEDSQPRIKEVEVPWTPVTQGSIYRFTNNEGMAEDLTIRCNSRYRYLLLRIYHKDDSPLNLKSISSRRCKQLLAFRHNGKQELTLMYANPKAQAPSYDLGSFIKKIEKEGKYGATLSTPEKNPAFTLPPVRDIPWTEKHKWLLTPVIILLVAAMALLIFKQIKHIKPDENQ